MSARTGFDRALASVGVLFLLTLLMIPFFYRPLTDTPPRVERGIMSFAGSPPLTRPVQLSASWTLRWIAPRLESSNAATPVVVLPVPGEWAGAITPGSAVLPGKGRAVYSLTLRALPPGAYQLYVPVTNAANRVFIDGKPVSSRGQIGDDAGTTRYDWRAQFVRFQASGRDVTIAIELAAFLHRSNGLPNAPVLGFDEPMNGWVARGWLQELIILAGLALVCAFNFVIFVFRRSDRASLYFSIAAVALLPMSMILGFDNIFSVLLPNVPFPAMILLGYCSTWAALPAFILYVRELYPEDTPVLLARTLLGAWAILFLGQLGLAIASNTYLSSQWFRLAPLLGLCAFVFIVLVMVRALRNSRESAIIFSVGIVIYIVSLLIFNLDDAGLIDWQATNHINTASVGTMALLFANIMVIADRWTRSIETAETMNSDLSQLLDVNSAVTSDDRLESLLTRIVGVTTRIIGAERSTLFLFDPGRDELWSLVAEGVELKEIRLPAGLGIAGSVFRNGRSETVDDAYADPRFHRATDGLTGFRTRNLVAAPVVARDGRKLGVLQALNSVSHKGFSASDEARLAAFAAQAAIAIDNATLFSEVVTSRNYNESILESMSSGVVTLRDGGHRARLNAAAARILKVTQADAEQADARAFIEAANPWIIPEIDAVAASGESRSFLDSDLVVASGETVSANLSIVPLRDAEGSNGVLVMLDDISSSKRLEGAMRRFMTQEVMDQVLGQESDALFGAACSASVLFADIRDFTSMSERLTPRATVDMLNETFTELFEAVAEAGGVLDKYIGDAVMAVFGAPLSRGDDALNAVASARRMQEMMVLLNARRAERSEQPLGLGIGIASGEVVAGTIGSPKRMDYTVIGDSVNLASRLQDLTKLYRCGILVCARTAGLVSSRCAVRELDTIRVRGRNTLENLFEVIVPREGMSEDALAAGIERYQTGRARLARRDWQGALEAFDEALAFDPNDGPAKLMRDRAARARADPPPANWDGIW